MRILVAATRQTIRSLRGFYFRRKMGNQCSPAPSSLVDGILEENGVRGRGSATLGLAIVARKVEVFVTAARVFGDYKIVNWRANQIEDEEQQRGMWDAAHERNAKLLAEKFINLHALWVKMGQYLSTRADVMPAAYLRELRVCQDSLEPAPFREVRAIIEKELGRPIEKVFASLDPSPLAVASIAAVHRAVLLDGRHVVVKVQHAQVRERLLADLKCLETIGDTIRWLDADFDFSPVVREWAKEVPNELDFVRERANMARVAQNLAPFHGRAPEDELGIDVRLAEVIDGLTTERLLVMSLVDGIRVNDAEQLASNGVDKERTMLHITRAYAQQIFGDGFYSADPHPGNILLDRRGGFRPVLLDFGLTKALSSTEKYYFAKLIVAAAENDIHGLLEALEGVGLRLRTDVPFDYSLLAKYFFRDALPQNEAQEQNAKRREEWRADAEARRRSLYAGDSIVVTSTVLGWNTSRNGEVLRVVDEAPGTAAGGSAGGRQAAQQLVVRLTDGKEVTVDVSACKLQSGRSPINSWPDAFIFFERVLNLLRGLTASLDVSQSYLQVMTPYARLSLQRQRPAGEAQRGEVHGADALGLAPLLRAALATGEALGCQVSVRRNGQVLAELSAGAADPYERTPVEPDTLFCSFSVTKAVASAAVHLLAQRGLLDLSEPVARYWPAFGANGKEGIRICDVLAHRAGLQNVGTAELAADPLLVADSDRMVRMVAEATPDPLTLGLTSYHYLSYGWIVEGLVRAVTGGVALRDFARAELAEPLGMSAEMGIGMPAGAGGAKRSTLVLLRDAEAEAKMRQQAASSAQAPAGAQAPSPGRAAAGDEGAVTEKAADPAAAPAAGASAGPTARSGRRPASSPSLLLNPTFFNTEKIRTASLPSANGHFSARALSAFYHSLAEPQNKLFPGAPGGLAGRLLQLKAASASAVGDIASGGERMMQGQERAFLSGFVHYEPQSPTEQDEKTVLVFGHSGLGGGLALCRCDTATGDVLSVAVTVNRLAFDARMTRRVVRHVFEQLSLPVPAAFGKD